ncbi:MAG TPA: MBL fold metallo-hydrolase [Candidatus Paceibacterota bacterium]
MKGYTLTGCGGIGNATGANFLLKTPDMKILVDCGLVQGSKEQSLENRDAFPYQAGDISYLLVTHAHMDHIGRIPKLVREGFAGTIYSTAETRELAAIMLEDAQMLLAREAKNGGYEPLYEKSHIFEAMALWKTVPYHQNFSISKNISFYLKDAGHILGSAIVEMTITTDEGQKKIAFTGDLGNSPTPLLRDTEYVTDADFMVIESVYGDRNHEPKDQRDAKLKRILLETLNRGGTVVIPAFSLERTQVILYEVNNLVERKELPAVPVFMDAPLGSKATEIYKAHIENFNKAVQDAIMAGDDIFDFPGLRMVRNPDESRAIHSMKEPKIIIAGSGMSVGGRVLSHEKFYLEDANATILLVGYQVPGSLGRKIEEKVPDLVIEGEKVKVRARIEKISGYSSHKDSNNLVEFVSHTAQKLQRIFVAMGETKSSSFLAQRLRAEVGVDAVVPEKNREYELF